MDDSVGHLLAAQMGRLRVKRPPSASCIWNSSMMTWEAETGESLGADSLLA